jgi:hypothetical protein
MVFLTQAPLYYWLSGRLSANFFVKIFTDKKEPNFAHRLEARLHQKMPS